MDRAEAIAVGRVVAGPGAREFHALLGTRTRHDRDHRQRGSAGADRDRAVPGEQPAGQRGRAALSRQGANGSLRSVAADAANIGFLISDAEAFMSWQTLYVNGGALIHKSRVQLWILTTA